MRYRDECSRACSAVCAAYRSVTSFRHILSLLPASDTQREGRRSTGEFHWHGNVPRASEHSTCSQMRSARRAYFGKGDTRTRAQHDHRMLTTDGHKNITSDALTDKRRPMKGAVHTHMARPALSQWPGHCIEIARSVLAMSAACRPGVPARPRARLLRRVVLTSFVLSSARPRCPRVVVGGRREAQRVDASSAQRAASARRARACDERDACPLTSALLLMRLQPPLSG